MSTPHPPPHPPLIPPYYEIQSIGWHYGFSHRGLLISTNGEVLSYEISHLENHKADIHTKLAHSVLRGELSKEELENIRRLRILSTIGPYNTTPGPDTEPRTTYYVTDSRAYITKPQPIGSEGNLCGSCAPYLMTALREAMFGLGINLR